MTKSNNAPVEHQQRAWMRLPSGNRLDLFNPDPEAWADSDLSTRLSRTFRWGGESCWPLPFSVAQHSLLVLHICAKLAGAELTPAEQLQELLHDAEEGFLGFDCISPLKPVLGEPFASLESKLSKAIWTRYELPEWTVEGYRRHKEADVIAAASEAVHCVGWAPHEVADVLGIKAEILVNDPLVNRYGGLPWEPWPAEAAAHRFHVELVRLASAAGIVLQQEKLHETATLS